MKTCPHLRPLVNEMRRRGASVSCRHGNWTEETGYAGSSIYYDVVFDPSLANETGLDREIRYRVFGITAQYAGFFCDRCSSLVAGVNPGYDPDDAPKWTPFAPDGD